MCLRKLITLFFVSILWLFSSVSSSWANTSPTLLSDEKLCRLATSGMGWAFNYDFWKNSTNPSKKYKYEIIIEAKKRGFSEYQCVQQWITKLSKLELCSASSLERYKQDEILKRGLDCRVSENNIKVIDFSNKDNEEILTNACDKNYKWLTKDKYYSEYILEAKKRNLSCLNFLEFHINHAKKFN